jgi:hypothetical protein
LAPIGALKAERTLVSIGRDEKEGPTKVLLKLWAFEKSPKPSYAQRGNGEQSSKFLDFPALL